MLATMQLDGIPGTKLHERVVAVQLSCSFSWGHVTDTEISDEINTAKHSRKALRVRKSLMFPSGSTPIMHIGPVPNTCVMQADVPGTMNMSQSSMCRLEPGL